MKKSLLIFYFLIASISLFAQVGEWTWMHGSNIWGNAGNFGIQGMPDPANEPPAIYEACEWTDLNGNFWIYGGYGNGIRYATLWKYDVVTNEWTWMKGPAGAGGGTYGTQGVSAPANRPPGNSHGSLSWTDKQGNLWMFAGANSTNALWKYSIATNEWTWMKGPNTFNQPGVYGTMGVPDPANTPGCRWEAAAAWTDTSGNLWMFGGAYNNTNGFNDLWKYDIFTNEWTWMKGDSLNNQPAVHGTIGVEDPANDPGARVVYARWTDKQNNLWLFGGANSSIPPMIHTNDLWRFNISTNCWTWMNGSNLSDQPGTYGNRCEADSLNTPGARFENRAVCTDQDGNLWMFGGGKGSNGGVFLDIWNDLWKYCITENKWIWVSGDSIIHPGGNWGTIGVSDPANVPDGRAGASLSYDQNGNIFMFGGSGYNFTPCNDLWRFKIDPTCGNCSTTLVAGFTADNDICEGTCIDFTNLSMNAISYQWTFPGATPSSSTASDPQQICYSSPGFYDVILIVSNANGNDTLTLSNYINVHAAAVPQSIFQSNDTLFALQGYATYQWYLNGNVISGSTNDIYIATQGGNYYLMSTDSNGCETGVAYSILPVATFSADSLLCPGTCTDFVNLSTFASTYIWNFPGGNPSVSSDVNPTGICYNSPGTYDVILIASDSVTSDTLTMNSFIIVYPSPPPQGILQSGDTLFANQGASSYQWYFNGIIISGATDYFYVATQNGDYNVVATDENDCEVEAVINNVISSTTPLSFGEGSVVRLYPNPVSESLSVLGYNGIAEEISVYNLLGEMVLAVHPDNHREPTANCKLPTDLDVRALTSGVYILEVTGNDKTFRVKFVKE